MKPLLDQMLAAQRDLAWPTDNAHMLGYRLREAMNIAKRGKIEPYQNLKDKFVIRNKGDKVYAEYRHPETIAALREVLSKMTLADIEQPMEIVGAAILHKAQEMYFPSVTLTDEDKLTLYQWTSKNGYYMIVAEVGVTLTRVNPGDVAWEP